MPAAKPTEQLITRAIAAWKAAGLVVGSLEVKADGTVKILAPIDGPRIGSSSGGNSCDDIFGTTD